jgi:hypothetical protein
MSLPRYLIEVEAGGISNQLTKIPNPNLERHARSTLIAPRQIITNPSNIPRKRGINAASSDEHARIDDGREAAERRRHESHNEAHQDRGHGPENVRASAPALLGGLVGEEAYRDGQARCSEVDRHGQELRCFSGVAEIVDDARQEQADAGERADNTPVHEEAEI